jgi:hypothetical protein
VFTKNTTEALNLVVRSLDYSSRKTIVSTALEHHSLLLPILEQQRRGDARVDLLTVGPQGEIDASSIERMIDRGTALVAVHHTTNTTGMRAPLETIVKRAHQQGALVLVDGAQSATLAGGLPSPGGRLPRVFRPQDVRAHRHRLSHRTQDALDKLDSFIVGGHDRDRDAAERAVEAGSQAFRGRHSELCGCGRPRGGVRVSVGGGDGGSSATSATWRAS